MDVQAERESAMRPLDIETMRAGRLRALDEVERLRGILRSIDEEVEADPWGVLGRIWLMVNEGLAE